MKEANWLKNQDAKSLTYIFPTGEDMAVGLPWRKAQMVFLGGIIQSSLSGGYHETPSIFRKK